MVTSYIGIGSNLGDRQGFIGRAIAELEKVDGVQVRRVSSIYETEPVSDIPQGRFLNGVIEIETTLEPAMILKGLKRIERLLGRRRAARNAPRTIDLDILYYGDRVIEKKGLIIPHPRIGEREFVLMGLKELGKTV